MLLCGETERVTAVEGVFAAKKDFGDEHIFQQKLLLIHLLVLQHQAQLLNPTHKPIPVHQEKANMSLLQVKYL